MQRPRLNPDTQQIYNGTKTNDENRQRKGQQIHHDARKCTQDIEKQRRSISSWSMVAGTILVRRLWFGYLPDHPIDPYRINNLNEYHENVLKLTCLSF